MIDQTILDIENSFSQQLLMKVCLDYINIRSLILSVKFKFLPDSSFIITLSHVLKMAEGNRVFVGNITNRVQKHELKGDFEKYGRVQEVFIGNGFGFITFDDGRSASRAVDVSFIINFGSI